MSTTGDGSPPPTPPTGENDHARPTIPAPVGDLSIDRQRCKARRSNGRGPCGRWPTRGAEVCASHGARAPQVKKAAAARVREAEVTLAARKALTSVDVVPVVDAMGELRQLGGECVQWKNKIGTLVDQLTDLRYLSKINAEQLRGEVTVFERALDRCLHALSVIAKLDLDGKMIQLEAAKVQLILTALNAGLDAAGLQGKQRELIVRTVAGELQTRSTAA